jgi:hypothetical protein
MDLVDLEFLELGCLAGKKMKWSYFCGSGAAWSSPKHALSTPSIPKYRVLEGSNFVPKYKVLEG